MGASSDGFALTNPLSTNTCQIMVWIRGRQFIFFSFIVLNSPLVQYPRSHLHFTDSLNLEPHSSLEVGSCEINFIIWKLLESKNPYRFVTKTFKTGVTYLQGFFDSSNFHLINMISQLPASRLLWGSRLRLSVKWRWLLGYWTEGLFKIVLKTEKAFLLKIKSKRLKLT